MSLTQLALWAIPLIGGMLGVWTAFQMWLAKRAGKTEQSLQDKLQKAEDEQSFRKEVDQIDNDTRNLSPAEIAKRLMS